MINNKGQVHDRPLQPFSSCSAVSLKKIISRKLFLKIAPKTILINALHSILHKKHCIIQLYNSSGRIIN
jgi:hypothetical protein